jgi:selenide, water dikinase
MSEPDGPLRLTRFARGGGCAAKLRLGALSDVLDRMAGGGAGRAGASRDDVLVDQTFSDDAAVVRPVGEGRGLVLTTDVIAPLVDDPEAFGEIAATNAISDVYAMGGVPSYALNLVFFPDDALPLDVLHAILRGGARACARAGVAVVGGHSVRDPEVKFGLAVAGEVELDRVLSNRGAAAGEALILSKAIGTGIIGNAIKADAATPDEIAAAIASMTTLNGGALAVARRHGVTACTDVTGFGIFGHLRNLLRGSGLAATVDLDAVPLLPGARAHAAGGLVPGGSRANRAFVAPSLRWAGGEPVAAEVRLEPARELSLSIACDAQTSGGLLLCVPAGRAAACVDELRAAGLPAAAIGRLEAPTAAAPAGTITVRSAPAPA